MRNRRGRISAIISGVRVQEGLAYLARDGATSISYLRLLTGSSQLEITVALSSAMVLDPDVLC